MLYFLDLYYHSFKMHFSAFTIVLCIRPIFNCDIISEIVIYSINDIKTRHQLYYHQLIDYKDFHKTLSERRPRNRK